MRKADMDNLRTICKETMHRLMILSILTSLDPKIKTAIDGIQNLRIIASDLFDVIAPGWPDAKERSPGPLLR